MNLELTKKQYISLVKALTIAGWMAASVDEEFEELTKELSELEQYVLSKAESFGANAEIYLEPEINAYYPTQKIEGEIADFLESYDDSVFWDELTHRMARRDLIEEYGLEKIQSMDPLNRVELEEEFLLIYSNEFTANGIENLDIVKE